MKSDDEDIFGVPKAKRKVRLPNGGFIYESMERVAKGINAGGGVTWLYLLQEAKMKRSKEGIAVSNQALARLGVGRMAKARALHRLEAAKLIRVRRQSGRLPRIKVLV